MDRDKSCIAIFGNPTLTVVIRGNGSGTVISQPLGIQCNPTCSASFLAGTPVALAATPTPTSFSVFTGWGGDCSGTNSVYSLVMDRDKSCTATFSSGNPTLTVVKQGSGSGTVTSLPSGIQCDPTCSTNFSVGTTATLTATPDSGSVFNGWTDDCTGTSPTASVDMLTDRICTAQFDIGGQLLVPSDSFGYSFPIYTVPNTANSATITATSSWGPGWVSDPSRRTTSAAVLVELPFVGGSGCDFIYQHPQNNAVSLYIDPFDQGAMRTGTITIGPSETAAIAGSDCFFGDNPSFPGVVTWSVQLNCARVILIKMWL